MVTYMICFTQWWGVSVAFNSFVSGSHKVIQESKATARRVPSSDMSRDPGICSRKKPTDSQAQHWFFPRIEKAEV